MGFVAIGPSKPFHRHDARKQLGPRVCLGGTFGQSFHRDSCKRPEFSSFARGTFGESFYRNLCFWKQFRFQARGTFGEALYRKKGILMCSFK